MDGLFGFVSEQGHNGQGVTLDKIKTFTFL